MNTGLVSCLGVCSILTDSIVFNSRLFMGGKETNMGAKKKIRNHSLCVLKLNFFKGFLHPAETQVCTVLVTLKK